VVDLAFAAGFQDMELQSFVRAASCTSDERARIRNCSGSPSGVTPACGTRFGKQLKALSRRCGGDEADPREVAAGVPVAATGLQLGVGEQLDTPRR